MYFTANVHFIYDIVIILIDEWKYNRYWYTFKNNIRIFYYVYSKLS